MIGFHRSGLGVRAARLLDEPAATSTFAKPKSRILAWPRLVTKILAGLMSRWTIPSECAASSASATSMARLIRTSSSMGLPPMRCFSVRPSKNSVTMNGRPSRLPISWIVQMFGWFNADAALASRWKRLRACGSSATFSGRNLSATKRPRSVSSAL